jgi:hypothetical protein
VYNESLFIAAFKPRLLLELLEANWAWWCTTVTLATWEAEVGGLRSEVTRAKLS